MKTSASVVVLVLAAAMSVSAQTGAGSIGVLATVAPRPLAVTGIADLRFGSVPAGLPNTVTPTDPGAGVFQLEAVGFVEVRFALPSALMAGAFSLPIDDYTGLVSVAPDGSGAEVVDPTVPSFFDVTGTYLYFFLGATVRPALDQAPANYLGQIVMTVAYM